MFFKSDHPQGIKYGIYAGLVEGIYIALISFFIIHTGQIYGSSNEPTGSFVLFLLLFVFSAVLSGLIVLSYPVYLVIQRKFGEAVKALVVTLLTLLFLFILSYLVFVVMVS